MAKFLVPDHHNQYQLKLQGNIGCITWPQAFDSLEAAKAEAQELIRHYMLVDAIEIHVVSHLLTVIRD